MEVEVEAEGTEEELASSPSLMQYNPWSSKSSQSRPGFSSLSVSSEICQLSANDSQVSPRLAPVAKPAQSSRRTWLVARAGRTRQRARVVRLRESILAIKSVMSECRERATGRDKVGSEERVDGSIDQLAMTGDGRSYMPLFCL